MLVPLFLICLGAAWLFSALGVFIRDTAQIMQFVATALMFASAVFYPASKIPATAWSILRFNPLLLGIEIARDGVLWHRSPNLYHLIYLWACGIAVSLVGHALFKKMRPAFADVL